MSLSVHEEDLAPAQFRIAIGRTFGTVNVGVRGHLDVASATHLGNILGDLIDGQGNLTVLVDLHDAQARDAGGSAVLGEMVQRAGWPVGQLILRDPPTLLCRALQVRGLGALIRITGHNPPRRPAAKQGGPDMSVVRSRP